MAITRMSRTATNSNAPATPPAMALTSRAPPRALLAVVSLSSTVLSLPEASLVDASMSTVKG